jgi:hypothetical protein
LRGQDPLFDEPGQRIAAGGIGESAGESPPRHRRLTGRPGQGQRLVQLGRCARWRTRVIGSSSAPFSYGTAAAMNRSR